MNTAQISGRLTRDPELYELPTGSLCRFSLAVSGMGRGETGYIDVSTFGKSAAACARHLRKGSPVAVSGRLDYSRFEASDRTFRSQIGVVARSVEFLPSPRTAAGSVS